MTISVEDEDRKKFCEFLVLEGGVDIVPAAELKEMRKLAAVLAKHDEELGEAFTYFIDIASDIQELLGRKVAEAKKYYGLGK